MLSRMIRVGLLVALVSLAALDVRSASLGAVPVSETEPNGTAATADVLTLSDGCAIVSGSITANDVDYYSFTAHPGSQVWALVDTSPSTSGNRNSLLTLIAPDGTTPLASDDDDGLGTDCDGTVENILSSAIAGELLSVGGTYFLRVEAAFAGDAVTSYKLSVVVTTTSTAEVESNNTTGTANPIVTAGSSMGVRTASIGTVGDVDYYSVVGTAGSTLLISADGGSTDIAVALIDTNGTTVILNADNSSTGTEQAESFCYNVTVSGTYFVRVSASVLKQFTGPYSLMVAACGLPTTPTPTPTVTLTPTVTTTSVVGGPTATPTLTATAATATPTVTRTATPIGGGGGLPPGTTIPMLSFPMLLVLGLGLVSAAFLVLRR